MNIPYFIYESPLSQESRYMGRLLLKGTCDLDGVVTRMLAMGSSLTKPDITAVLELLTAAVGHLCQEGYRVDLEGLVKITPTLGGIFTGLTDTFQSPRNSLYLTAQVSKALNKTFVRQVTVKRVITDKSRPHITSVVDSEAVPGSRSLTPGHIISLKGQRLKFDPANLQEYLRLVNAADTTEFVTVPKFYKLTQLELVFRLPETSFTEGYFEVASFLASTTIRVGQSAPFTLSTPTRPSGPS